MELSLDASATLSVDAPKAADSTPPSPGGDTPRLVLKPKPPPPAVPPAVAAAAAAAAAPVASSQPSASATADTANKRSVLAMLRGSQSERPGGARPPPLDLQREAEAGAAAQPKRTVFNLTPRAAAVPASSPPAGDLAGDPSPTTGPPRTSRERSSRKTGPPKKLVPEGVGQHAAQVIVAKSFNPNSPKIKPEESMMPPPALKLAANPKKRPHSDVASAAAPAGSAAAAAAAGAAAAPAAKKAKTDSRPSKKLSQRKPSKASKAAAKAAAKGAGVGGTDGQPKDDGDISEEELTEQEEEIDEALVTKMEEVISAFGDEPIDGYVVWAKFKGPPRWGTHPHHTTHTRAT